MPRALILGLALASTGPLSGQAGRPAPLPAAPEIPAGEWPGALRDPAGTRWSPLALVTPENVDQLEEVWRFDSGVTGAWEGSPLVVGSVMFLHTPWPNRVVALDLAVPGRVLWTYTPPVAATPPPTAARGAGVRGLAWHPRGLVFAPIASGDLAALDAATGREIWRARDADVRQGATITGAPLVAGDLVLIGVAGGEYGVRGYLNAHRADNGQLLWRGYSTGADADLLLSGAANVHYPSHAARGLGQTTWPPGAWQHGGGTTDGWLTWDPELQLVYHGTGAPAPWNASLRPGENKWTSSILARDLATGRIRWALQLTPGDAWGFGAESENLLADLTIGGRPVKALVHVGRNGFVYTVDRGTGRLLAVERGGPANWAADVDPFTAAVRLEPRFLPSPAGMTRGICPATVGLKGSAPAALDPASGMVFAPLVNLCMDVQTTVPRLAPPEPYLGASWRILPGPGPSRGRLVAWDPAAASIRWEVGEPWPLLGGTLATASGLVFYATADGWLKAVDQANGRVRWRHQLPGPSLGSPMTFLGPDGRQFLAVTTGAGGWAAVPGTEATRGLGWTGREPAVLVVLALPDDRGR